MGILFKSGIANADSTLRITVLEPHKALIQSYMQTPIFYFGFVYCVCVYIKYRAMFASRILIALWPDVSSSGYTTHSHQVLCLNKDQDQFQLES